MKETKDSVIKRLKEYIRELEEMLGCAAPQSYCNDCSCGKREMLENEETSKES